MPEIVRHTKPDSIWLFDYNSLEAMEDCPVYVVCLSERDINIIWQSVLNIDRFRSRVFTARNGISYTIADLDQWGQFREWVSDMNVNMGDFMACNGVLERIAEALEGMSSMSNCCGGIEGVNGGSSGSGMEPEEPSDVEDTEASHEGPPPPGFSDWDEFDQKKCDWANKIFDDIIVDVATMGAVTIGTTVATGLAAILVPLLVTPVGWVIILEIAVLMIAAAATSGFYGFISTHLEDYRIDYICALLAGENVTDSIALFGEQVDENISEDANFNALTGYWASSILKSLATIDSVNRMYVSQPFAPPTGDCSECEPEDRFFIDIVNSVTAGQLVSGDMFDQGTIESVAIDLFGGIRQVMQITSTGTPQDNYFRIDNVLDDSGAANYTFEVYDNTNTLIYSDTVSNLSDLEGYESPACKSFQIRDSTGFTSTFSIQFSWSETPF